jgi:hypothetical protein
LRCKQVYGSYKEGFPADLTIVVVAAAAAAAAAEKHGGQEGQVENNGNANLAALPAEVHYHSIDYNCVDS